MSILNSNYTGYVCSMIPKIYLTSAIKVLGLKKTSVHTLYVKINNPIVFQSIVFAVGKELSVSTGHPSTKSLMFRFSIKHQISSTQGLDIVQGTNTGSHSHHSDNSLELNSDALWSENMLKTMSHDRNNTACTPGGQTIGVGRNLTSDILLGVPAFHTTKDHVDIISGAKYDMKTLIACL